MHLKFASSTTVLHKENIASQEHADEEEHRRAGLKLRDFRHEIAYVPSIDG